MALLPTEIYSAVIREVTWVPEAFDTSPPVIDESREAVVDLLHESMLAKTTLRLVSKAFYDLTEEFLYETVMIFRFDFMPIILELLQSTAPGRRRPRGYRCRRLEFYLGTGNVDYLDTAWNEGGHTLWGLIPACPFLEILLCRVVCRDTWTPAMNNYPEYPHLTHNALWKTMARYCAGTLRRLELYGFHIRMDRVEMMLRYFSKLEVCRIVHAVAFIEGAFRDDDGCYRDLDDLPCRYIQFDDEEPPYRSIEFGCRGVNLFDKDEIPSECFDSKAYSEFDEAKRNASWPPFSGNAPYILPSLHTLLLDNFNDGITQFLFPALQQLGAYSPLVDGRQLFAHTHAIFPPSVTHLIYEGGGIALVDLLSFFPHLTTLTLHIFYAEFHPSAFKKPFPSLSIIKMPRSVGYKDVGPFVLDILSAVRLGMLPSLGVIEITRFDADARDDALPFEESEALGVSLVVRTVPPFRLSGECSCHD